MFRFSPSKSLSNILGFKFIPLNSFLTAFILILTLRRFYKNEKKIKKRIKVVFLPKTLFTPDLENIFLPEDNDMELYYISREPLKILAKRLFPETLNEFNYFSEDNKDIQIKKKRLEKHWLYSLKIFSFITKTKCFLTPSYYYRDQHEFAKAAINNNINFIALHKECITSPITRLARESVYKDSGGPFYGSMIVTQNQEEKDTMVKAGCFDKDRILVTGCPRIDPFFNSHGEVKARYFDKGFSLSESDISQLQNRKFDIVFFSFNFKSYLPIFRGKPKWPKNFKGKKINPWDWSKLGERFHSFVFDFAKAYPDLDVALKVKQGNKIPLNLKNRSISKNLKIFSTGEGGILAANAKVISAFNTTVIFESIASRTPVIIPAFEEACLNSSEKEIGTLQLESTVDYAENEKHFEKLILEKISNYSKISKTFSDQEKQILKRYIGFYDGESGVRTRNVILDHIRSGL